MAEQFNGETGPETPEKNEDQLHNELMETLGKQDVLIKKMGTGEAENIEELMTQMDDSMQKGNEIWEAYKRAMEKSREQEKI